MRRFGLLASPVFVFCIVLLIANDFLLKPTFHNWFTGKLSDVVGLVAVALLGCASFPRRRLPVAISIAVLFAFWKSEHSQRVLDAANEVLPYRIGRTVDYSDLIAIPFAWIACVFAFSMRAWPARRWMLQLIAGTSVVMFGATTCIHTHAVREIADLSSRDTSSANRTESELTSLLDELAAQYKLECSLCDALSSGRVYGSRDFRGISLTASYDPQTLQILYDIRMTDMVSIPAAKAKEVDGLRDRLESALRMRFPNLRVETARARSTNHIQLGVYRKGWTRSPDDDRDHARALAVIEDMATKFRLRREQSQGWRSSLYYAGRLLGPNPYERELVLRVGRADDPLVPIDVTCASPKFDELQQSIVLELESRLKAEFGDDRAKIRTWFIGRCK